MIKSKRYTSILTVAIIAFSLLSPLKAPAYPGKIDLIPGQEWMGIYMGKDKIGYSVTSVQKGNNVYMVSEKTFMKLNVMGTSQTVDIVMDSMLDQSLSLKSFRFRLQSGALRLQTEAEVNENEMALRINSGGHKIQKTIPLKTTPHLSGSLRFVLMQQGLRVGKKFTLPVFDPLTMSAKEITIQVEEKEKLTIGDKTILAYRLKKSFKGVVVRAWISEEGDMLKEESPLGIVLKWETREKALTENRGEGAGLEIIASTAVPVTTPIENPGSVKYLRVELKGIPLHEFNLENHRQVLKGTILEITQEKINTDHPDPIPVKERGFERCLESSPFIQSNAPEIIEKANTIISGEKDPLKSAKLLMRWVYKTIDKKPTISIPSAFEVLKTKVGDCNEHTVLFTALARAVGIPTRIITGIVLFNDSFYYHTWAEIFKGKWISIDPTMNQFPADATHIGFVEGGLDKQVEMIKVIGHLKADILEYR